MTSNRLPYCYGAKVCLIRLDAGATQEIQFGGTVLADNADEARDIAIVEFFAKTLPAVPGYRVGGKFDFFDIHVGSDAGFAR